MANVRRICWLIRDDDRALRAHVILGDEIGFGETPDTGWFAPAGAVSGGSGILMLRYESGGEAVLFCLLSPPGFAAGDVDAIRIRASLEGAERVWRPFVERLGPRLPPAGPTRTWQQSEVLWNGGIVRFRRARHTNHVIDRLLMRERHRLLKQFEGQAA